VRKLTLTVERKGKKLKLPRKKEAAKKETCSEQSEVNSQEEFSPA
jgi:hypothetical protein